MENTAERWAVTRNVKRNLMEGGKLKHKQAPDSTEGADVVNCVSSVKTSH